eukprot:2273935-Rhodomonas_salina.9
MEANLRWLVQGGARGVRARGSDRRERTEGRRGGGAGITCRYVRSAHSVSGAYGDRNLGGATDVNKSEDHTLYQDRTLTRTRTGRWTCGRRARERRPGSIVCLRKS